jgi:hypothetical protein
MQRWMRLKGFFKSRFSIQRHQLIILILFLGVSVNAAFLLGFHKNLKQIFLDSPTNPGRKIEKLNRKGNFHSFQEEKTFLLR